METNEAKKEQWYKTWWGIIILILLWPFSLSYYIWTKKTWSRNLRIGLIALIIIVVLYGFWVNSFEKTETAKNTEPLPQTQVVNTATATPEAEKTAISSPTNGPMGSSEPSPLPDPEYDKSKGNNWVAAKQAEEMMGIVNKASPGAFTDILLELSPEKVDKDEDGYKASVNSAFLSVEVNSAFWRSLDDDSKKDVVASLVIATGNIFKGAYPHIYVNNGTRRVAEGEYNFFKTEPKITLK